MPRASVDVIPYVSKWFSDRRLGLGPLSQFSHRLMPCDMPQVPQVETDVSRKLEWLATQVQPSVEALIRAGKRDEVYRALGLEDS
jgi:hypothetical protein